MLLNKKQRRTVRALTHAQWRWATSDLELAGDDGGTYQHRRLLDYRKGKVAGRIKEDLRESFGTGIIANILIALAMKLAMKYIEEWVKDSLFGSKIPRKFTEVRK
jgi:hypothetical protein